MQMELTRRRFVVATGAAVAATGVAANPALADGSGKDKPGPREPKGEWLAGDTHVHDDHSSDGSLPRQTSHDTKPGNLPVGDQIGQGAKTGLAFMPLTDHRTYDQHWDPQYTSSELILIPGEEANGSPHAVVLGHVDVIVDGANPPGSAAFRHVQQSVWDAHAQDAVWQTAHPDDGEYTRAGGPNDNASTQGVDTVEVLNVSKDPDAQMEYAENRWNAGFRFGVTGASDCHFRELWDIAGPGQPTTWVFATERSERGILDALRAGRTSVSASIDGPFVTLEADVDGDGQFEAIGGDEVVVRDRHLSKKAALRVRVKGGVGATVLVYAAPGRSAGPVATFRPVRQNETYELPLVLKGDHTWYRVEVRSPGSASGADADPDLPDQFRGAASPVFISVQAPADPSPAIPLPLADRTADHATAVFGEAGGFAGFADVAADNKVTHVVAEVHENHRSFVVYRQIDARGRRTKVITLSGDSPTARSPRVAASGEHVWVVWQDSRGKEQPHRPAILLRESKDGGRTFEAAERLSKDGGRAIHPAIALLDDKHPLVAWSDNSGGAFDVYARIIGIDRAPVNLSAAGKTIVEGTPDDSRSPHYPASLFPSVAVTADRRALVTWQDNRFDPDPLWTGHTPAPGEDPDHGTDPDNWQILGIVRPSPGRAWEPPVQISAATDVADRHPSVTADRDGGFVVMWESSALRSSGVNLSLRACRSTDGGTTWSAWESVALEATAMSQRPRLSTDADGTVRAVWYDTRAADWRWKVWTATLDRRTGWTTAKQLTTLGNNTWAAAAQGVVVFTSDRAATRTQRDRTQQIYLLRTR
ncbi:CehA/McbA family metallohydrolase [Streptomyces sp. NPDC089424]|uniref:CehA/McbA family metallohydrolase n=1 Tax=Streptomyces sp. NPDC089424 TaxID=3365917 RepID=UPI0037F876AE